MEKLVLQVLNYNDAESIISLVERIYKYNCISNILVVDNGSTDDSLKQLKKRYWNDKKIIIIETGKNGGYGFGQNFGINYINEKLKSDYAVITSPGVFFSEKTIQTLLRFAKEKKAGIVSATQKINGKVSENAAWKIPTPFQWAFIESRLRSKIFKEYHYNKSFFYDNYSKVDCVLGAMFLVDVKKFIDVGGYDENMFLFGEETLLGFKMKKKGYSTYILNKYFYEHPISTTINKNIPSILKQDKITHNSKLLFMEKYQKCNLITLKCIKCFFSLQEIRKSKKIS